jgi:UTP--glucose-1-phosphate uridylyltransferase
MLKIKKVVLPVAGTGTRLLPVTKEQPKEMLPVFSIGSDGKRRVSPIVQLIFEQLFEENLRNFCFIVGKNKRIIEDHFTYDEKLLHSLKNKNKNQYATDLIDFFKKVNKSDIVWVNQAKPLGFGHAVLQAQSYVNNETFLLHAGDTLILSKNNSHLKKLIQLHHKNKASASFIVKEIDDPRQYGVIDGIATGNDILVKHLEEKPTKPKSNLAIMPIYIFEPIIFKYIKKTKPKKLNEIQLTDAIVNMVKDGHVVCATNLSKEMILMDIGNPESYWDSLKISYENS